jgi:hypothetical protein
MAFNRKVRKKNNKIKNKNENKGACAGPFPVELKTMKVKKNQDNKKI